jgi:2-polyprenyl-6-methoxyphenol hydroxylase-like FAD-dependent oxidoreductase
MKMIEHSVLFCIRLLPRPVDSGSRGELSRVQTAHQNGRGEYDVTTTDVCVIGAGLGGLVAAVTAARAGKRVALIDPSSSGGRAATDVVGDFRFNRGPHAFANAGKALPLLVSLGINCDGKQPPLQKTHYWVDDEMVSMFSPRLLGAKGTLQFGRVLTKMSTNGHKEKASTLTVSQYLDECEVQPRVRAAIEALVRLSTYAHCPDVISVDLAMQVLATGTKGVRYVHGGWGSLISQLRERAIAEGVTLIEEKARSVEESDESVRVEVGHDRELRVSTLICALGSAEATATLLGQSPSSWHVGGVKCETTHLDLGLSAVPKHRVVIGLKRPFYAITHQPPARLAPEGSSVVHVMRYIHPNETLSVDDERRELNEAAEAIGVTPSSRVEERFLHRMSTFTATPTPDTGGMAGRPSVKVPDSRRLFVCGDWVGPGWLAEAVVPSATAAAQAAVLPVG